MVEIFSVAGYFTIAWLFIEYFNISEYEWMRESGDSVCNIPRVQDDGSDIIAPLFLLLFGAPLLIALTRDIIRRDIFKTTLYAVGLIAILVHDWWSFWGQYSACPI